MSSRDRIFFTPWLKVIVQVLGQFPIFPNRPADWCANCVFNVRSMEIGTLLEHARMNIYSCRAIADLSPDSHGSHFPKWLPANTNESNSMLCSSTSCLFLHMFLSGKAAKCFLSSYARSRREANFRLDIDCPLVWFFSLDRSNYAR